MSCRQPRPRYLIRSNLVEIDLREDILSPENWESVMRIRELASSDYYAMVDIWQRAGLSCRLTGRDSQERYTDEVGRETAVFLGAETDNQLVGVVLGTHDGRKGWINRLAVLPGFRHQGVARLLVREAEDRFHAMGIKIVTCLIEGDNEESMAFFEAIGYVGQPAITYYSKRECPDW